jgi:hypothetical protein
MAFWMSLHDLGSIGGIGMIVSSVHLSDPIPQDTRSIRTARFRGAARHVIATTDAMATDRELSMICWKELEDSSSLEPTVCSPDGTGSGQRDPVPPTRRSLGRSPWIDAKTS